MRDFRVIAALLMAAPLYAQYGGPAVLARGQAPAAMQNAQIDFRPYLSVSAGYDQGLNGIGADTTGKPFSVGSWGVEASGGVSGLHSWKHTQVGLDYRAAIRHYPSQPYYDGTDQSVLLGITHQLSRHVTFSLRNSAGLFSQNFQQPGLAQTVPFDPGAAYIPTNDFFDNRTMFFSTQADLQVQKSTRVSYAIGADGFMTRRRSNALFGVSGAAARGDIQYRISRRSTFGAAYSFTHYSFAHIFSSTDLHNFSATYGVRLSKSLEFGAFGGATRYEIKFIQVVPVDPQLAIFICVPGLPCVAKQPSDTINWIPSGSGRLSYTMKRGVFFVNGGRSVTPGNGLFLTSTASTLGAGYVYTAIKKWSANLSAVYNTSDSVGNVNGNYGSYMVTLMLSRQVARFTHGTLSFNARKYESADFRNYNKWSWGGRIGLGFAPGDVPMRLW